jgi:hypothetical protein
VLVPCYIASDASAGTGLQAHACCKYCDDGSCYILVDEAFSVEARGTPGRRELVVSRRTHTHSVDHW